MRSSNTLPPTSRSDAPTKTATRTTTTAVTLRRTRRENTAGLDPASLQPRATDGHGQSLLDRRDSSPDLVLRGILAACGDHVRTALRKPNLRYPQMAVCSTAYVAAPVIDARSTL